MQTNHTFVQIATRGFLKKFAMEKTSKVSVHILQNKREKTKLNIDLHAGVTYFGPRKKSPQKLEYM
jgi:predicted transcriptional regulator